MYETSSGEARTPTTIALTLTPPCPCHGAVFKPFDMLRPHVVESLSRRQSWTCVRSVP